MPPSLQIPNLWSILPNFTQYISKRAYPSVLCTICPKYFVANCCLHQGILGTRVVLGRLYLLADPLVQVQVLHFQAPLQMGPVFL